MTIDPQIIGLIAFVVMLGLIAIGVPIAFSMLAVAAIVRALTGTRPPDPR